MKNAGLEETHAGSKIARRNISNLRYAHDTTLMPESEEEVKSLLMKVKEESEKADLKLSIQKLRLWHPVPLLLGKHLVPLLHRWGNNGNSEIVCFWGLPITADGD